MKDWDWREWLIVAGFVAVAILLLVAVLGSASAQTVDVPGCRTTKHPAVCAASYHKCDDIGLDDACLAVAKLDGEVGYDIMSGRQIPTSQNK